MMAARNRQYINEEPLGLLCDALGCNGGPGTFAGTGNGFVEDVVAQGDCWHFRVDKWSRKGGYINGQNGPTSATNFVAQKYANSVAFTHHTIAGVPTNATFAARAAARTNPSRPYVDIMVNVLEMADIVRTIQVKGTTLIKKAAEHNLRYNFGIAPLVGDLFKLTKFQEQVNRRVLELKRLAGPRGLRRTVDLGTWSKSETTQTVVNSGKVFYSLPWYWNTTLNVRGHCRWIPGKDFDKLDAQEMGRLARKAVLGLTLDPSTLWEAFPFSWLIDWSTNLGSLLKAKRNIVPATLLSTHIMRHTHTDHSCPYRLTGGTLHISEMNGTRDLKTRVSVSQSPSAHFPFLDGKQMGILASLAIMRT